MVSHFCIQYSTILNTAPRTSGMRPPFYGGSGGTSIRRLTTGFATLPQGIQEQLVVTDSGHGWKTPRGPSGPLLLCV